MGLLQLALGRVVAKALRKDGPRESGTGRVARRWLAVLARMDAHMRRAQGPQRTWRSEAEMLEIDNGRTFGFVRTIARKPSS